MSLHDVQERLRILVIRGLCDGRAGSSALGTASRYDSPRQGGAAIAGRVWPRAVAGSARDISSTSARETCPRLGERATSVLFVREIRIRRSLSQRRSASPRPSGASRWLCARPGDFGGSDARQRARGAGGTAWATAEGGRGGGHELTPAILGRGQCPDFGAD